MQINVILSIYERLILFKSELVSDREHFSWGAFINYVKREIKFWPPVTTFKFFLDI